MKEYILFIFVIFILQLTTSSIINDEEIETDYVTIRSTSLRSLNGYRRLHVRAFGEDHHLVLKPETILSPSFRIVTTGGGNGKNYITSSPVPEDVAKNGQFYSIAASKGSLYIKDGDEIAVEGILDENLHVFPISREIHPEKVANHVVYRYPSRRNVVGNDTMVYSDNHSQEVPKFQILPSVVKRQTAPSEVSVEILVVFDYANSKALEFNNSKLTTYSGVFLNSASHVYADTKDPSVKLSLAGIVVTSAPDDQPYITDNKVDDATIDDKTLTSFKNWIDDKKSSFPNFDDAVLLTAFNAVQNSDGVLQDTIVGLAYVGGVCNNMGFNTGFVEDKAPSFTGVLTAAHEIAHTLNVPHDGDGEAASCPYKDGYRMGSSDTKLGNSWKFSSCSLAIMKSFVTSRAGSCTWNKPKNSETNFPLPFDISSSLDDQCKARFDSSYTFAGKLDDEMCQTFWCTNDGGQYLSSIGTAIEGTPCGIGKICLRGVCSPSSVPSLDNQCITLFGQGFTADQKNSPEVCKQLYCANGASKQTKGGAADGSACGNYGVCKESQCILQVVSSDDQCKRNFGGSYHTFTGIIDGNDGRSGICETLWCSEDDRALKSRGPADPNTSCESGKVCKDKKCVAP